MLWMKLTSSLLPGILTLGVAIAQPVPAPRNPPALQAKELPQCYLGIGFQDIDPDRAASLKLDETSGIEITMVAEDSPALKAGLKTGDIVLEYNGHAVKGMESFSSFVYETPANREIKLSVLRGDQVQIIPVLTGARQKKSQRAIVTRTEVFRSPGRVITYDTPRATMSWNSGMLGIEAEGIQGDFAHYFGVKTGVLVRLVGKNTAAEKAGLKAGDVIVKVDDVQVVTARQITGVLREGHDQKTFRLSLVREKHPMTVSVTLDGPEVPSPTPARSVKQ